MMRSTLLGATMLCALSTGPAFAQSFRPLPTPTPTATPTPSAPVIRRLPARTATPAPAPTATPSPMPAIRAMPARQVTPSATPTPSAVPIRPRPTPTPTPAPLIQRAPRTPIGSQPVQTGPITPTTPINKPVGVTPVATGPLHVQIIDPGYAEPDNSGARTISIDACLVDAKNVPGTVQDMHYTIELPGGTRKGEMQPYFQPSKAPTYKSAGVQGANVGHCRRATVKLKPCEVPPGDYPIRIDAQPTDRAPSYATGQTVLGGYSTKMVWLELPKSFEALLPGNIAGQVLAPCGAAKGVEVSVTSYSGDEVKFKTDSDGKFAGSYIFTRPGKATLTAMAASGPNSNWSKVDQPLTVASPPVIGTVLNQPKLVKLGTPATFTVRLRHATSNLPLKKANVTLLFGGQTCKAVASSDGTASCAVTIPTSETQQIGSTPSLVVTVADINTLNLTGMGVTRVADPKGLTSRTISGFGAELILIDMQKSRPGGVLLQSYNPKWSGTGAHLDGGSLVYPTLDFKNPIPFDIPTFNNSGFSYYLDGVMIRVGEVSLEAPSRVRVPLSITSSLEGRGPRLKGFCFETLCGALVGYDNSAPDFNNIKLNNGFISIDLYVDNGHVKARLGPVGGTVDFSCGGIASLVCGYLRDTVNSQLQKRIEGMFGPNMLALVSGNIDANVQAKLKESNIATLTSISFLPDGTLTLVGIPITQ